jgi:hypothetical protein
MNEVRKILFIATALISLVSCIKPFNPPAVTSANLNMLVVDGFIVPGSATTIRLSRTLNITDSFQVIPERNAQMYIEGKSGASFAFQSDVDGTYTSTAAFISPDDQYRLRIILQDGKEYLSDFVEVKESPPIDSLNWEEGRDDVSILVNTHDPAGRARYYKWEFDETVEYRAIYESLLDYVDGQIIFLDPDSLNYQCFKFYKSKDISLGNSSSLSDDIVLRGLVTKVPNDNTRILHRYSINVKQYALTPEAFKYWDILQANTEQNGNLFDPQPAQLRSNIHCTTNPDEPVIGFVSVSNVTEKRIFIRGGQLKNRPPVPYLDFCNVTIISPSLATDYLSDGKLKPAYFLMNGSLAIAPAICVDCRLQGGTKQKPSYW